MDGENNGSKPYFLMDDWGGGVKTPIFGLTSKWTCRPNTSIVYPFKSLKSLDESI